jgi:HK97 gp10 family phage protein
MASDFTVRIGGLDEINATLKALPTKLRRGLVRNALAAGARVFRDDAKRLTPVLRTSTYSGGSAIKRGVRKPGTLRNAIRVRTSKRATRRGDVGVFVNVLPAKGAFKGAKSPNDPFYWRFLEFGTRNMRAFGFLQSAARSKGVEALAKIVSTLGPAINKLNRKGGTQ